MIEAIKVEREKITNELDRLFDRLAVLDSALEVYGVKKMRPRKRHPRNTDTTKQSNLALATGDVTPMYQGLTQMEAVYKFLAAKGVPVHVDAIASVLIQRGITMRGDTGELSEEEKAKKLKQSLVRGLLRDPRFKNLGKNVFALTENQTSAAPLASFNPYDPTGTPYSRRPFGANLVSGYQPNQEIPVLPRTEPKHNLRSAEDDPE